jgi:hypothetical protein
MIDRRLAWMVVAFGVLVTATGVVGALQGSVAAAGAGGVLGVGIGAAGLAMVAGRRIAVAASLVLCVLVALAMLQRMHETGRALPAAPGGILSVALAYALGAERRRARRSPRATPPSAR